MLLLIPFFFLDLRIWSGEVQFLEFQILKTLFLLEIPFIIHANSNVYKLKNAQLFGWLLD